MQEDAAYVALRENALTSVTAKLSNDDFERSTRRRHETVNKGMRRDADKEQD